MKTPDCPFCGSARNVRPEPDRRYWCQLCNKEFDDDEDAGTHCNDPTRRFELADERAKRARQEAEARRARPVGFRRTRRYA